ncbi:hypothetical protein C8Q75DRAFT_786204 [Abortiporus biennis]|nr:hypothetical protein C8Q75DRAFT_786204 [Abortiporus biennis]
MARGGPSPGPLALPKVAFTKVEEDTRQPSGVHDQQARSYGYNDMSFEFHRPDGHYIRYIEPLESELAVQVEYDMDEQDQEWLEQVNAERKKEQIDKVSYEVFEIIMDRLEKEWFDLTKNIPKPDLALPSEDSTCAICDDSEGENTNAIVFCDGCNLAVHQDCYGVPYIPEGQWLCRKCTVSPENPVSCILCPNEGGAFKQTVDGEWVHLLCAIWVPETRVANDVFMEPVTGVDKISKQRWKLRCSVCDIREGACIQCNKSSCFLAFHATCARKERLLMPMKSSQGSEAPALAAYCEKHLPREQAEIRAEALAAEQSAEEDTDNEHGNLNSSPKSSKTARAYSKTYKPGPPLVPHIIVQRILQYISKVIIRQKDKFVQMVCRYWSLKREARRGAPLLKRLHLEPWTASSTSRQQGDDEKGLKLEVMKMVRGDLERIRALADLCRRREIRKLDQANTLHDILMQFLFPHENSMRFVFERIMAYDRKEYFKNPVNKVEVPDYYDIIKNPICWSAIDRKLDNHEYWDLRDFKNDINLVINNAITYNKPGTPFHKTALKIQSAAEPLFAELDKFVIQHPDVPVNEAEQLLLFDDDEPLGNFEPPLELVELLSATDTIQEDMNIILQSTPVESLFNFEHPVLKPPRPPPPPRASKPSKKQRQEARRLARQQARLDASVHAPRTRSAAANQAAFEAEAHDAGPSTSSRRGTKRKPVILPGQSEVPPMVEDVDKRDLFTHFDGGWILPPDHKRGGRAPVDKMNFPPPPKKRVRVDRERAKSHLSIVSTSAAENETLVEPLNQPSDTGVAPVVAEAELIADGVIPAAPDEVPMDVDLDTSYNQPTESVAPSTVEARPSLPQESMIAHAVKQPSVSQKDHVHEYGDTDIEMTEVIQPVEEPSVGGQYSIEEMKAEEEEEASVEEQATLLKDEEEEEEEEEIEVEAVSKKEEEEEEEEEEEPPRKKRGPREVIIIEQLDTPLTRREKYMKRKKAKEEEARRAAVAEDLDSDLSSLSDLSDESESEEERAPSPPKRARPEPKNSPATVEEGRSLEGGTLVWAKINTYPWWPAVVFERDDPEVPKQVLKDEQKAQGKKGPIHLVRFYDTNSQWAWLSVDRLFLFDEDKGKFYP